MEKIIATVVIWGNDNYNVLGLLRQLTPVIEEVIFLVNKNNMQCATISKYCKKYVIAQTIEKGIEYLKELGKTLNCKGFVITTNDVLAECVDQNYGVLSHYYHLTGTKEQGILTKMQGKIEMSYLAKQLGFDIPRSYELSSKTNIENFVFPLLVKPNQQTVKNRKPFKFRVFNTRDELRLFQKGMLDNDIYIAQQVIKKEEEYLMYGCRLADGNVVLPGAIIKQRWHYGRVTPEIPSTINIKLMKLFLERIDYYGLFSFEYGLMDGKAYFFEVNLRNDGTSLYYYLSGVNLPLLWITSYFNKQITLTQKVDRENVFIDGFGDLANVLTGELSLCQWRKDVKNSDIYRYYDSNDWKPFFIMACKTIPRIVVKSFFNRMKNKEKR